MHYEIKDWLKIIHTCLLYYSVCILSLHNIWKISCSALLIEFIPCNKSFFSLSLQKEVTFHLSGDTRACNTSEVTAIVSRIRGAKVKDLEVFLVNEYKYWDHLVKILWSSGMKLTCNSVIFTDVLWHIAKQCHNPTRSSWTLRCHQGGCFWLVHSHVLRILELCGSLVVFHDIQFRMPLDYFLM